MSNAGKETDSPLKVFIVDDHDMVRLGLRTYLMLEPGMEVVGEAGDGQQALDVLDRMEAHARPDIILMDMMMPGMDGVAATRAVTERYPGMKVIMLTSFLEEDKIVQAIEAGAFSYVLKTVSSGELIGMIRSAFSGLPVMNPEVSRALTRGLRRRSSQAETGDFTPREKEVLMLIAEGKSNKDIAEELHISIKTVKTHVSNLLMKCGLEDRTQLAVYAHRKGWVQGT
jgi:NarL family two-component system response regulator LiaR